MRTPRIWTVSASLPTASTNSRHDELDGLPVAAVDVAQRRADGGGEHGDLHRHDKP